VRGDTPLFVFTDRVIAEIAKDIAAHEPELGGALLGPPASPLVTAFLFDPQASVTRASYVPSSDLVRRVEEKERIEGVEFKGVVHSHPGKYDEPSGPDRHAFRRGLDLNPRMAAFLAPILTRDRNADPNVPNEIAVDRRSRMTVYAAYRAAVEESPREDDWRKPVGWRREEEDRDFRSRGPDASFESVAHRPEWWRANESFSSRPRKELLIEKPRCQVMPVGAHASEVIAELAKRGYASGALVWGMLAFNGVHFISTTLEVGGNELIFLFAPTYPISKPVVLATKLSSARKHDTKEIAFEWGLMHRRSLWEASGVSLMKALLEKDSEKVS
jgi:proteasome lid subunit RPN8/RPN11